MVATLAVHPTLTTRARSQKQIEESNLALRYLRLILKVVGPVNSNLDEVFVFSGLGTSSRRGGSGRRRPLAQDASPTGSDPDSIENDLAQSGAIWTHAEDIWQVIGWAFNCSVIHKKRWARWRFWIEYILDAFEKDWEARGLHHDMDEEGEEDQSEKSLIVKSLGAEGTTTGRERKTVRAIFADGSPRSVAEFPEIWKNETKERRKDGEAKDEPRKIPTKIDIEADNYGDYLNEGSESDLADSDPDHISKTPHPSSSSSSSPLKPTDLTLPLGGTPALHLRLRFLSLLSTVSFTTLTTSPSPPLPTIHDTYLEHIRPLPLPTFFTLTSPLNLHFFPPLAASSLIQSILRSLISTSAPLPEQNLSQQTLETNYLPFPANTNSIADNAKVSLCIETLLRLFDRYVGLAWTPTLQDAVEEGIRVREGKATRVGRKRGGAGGGGDGGDERIWLRGSAERMRTLVSMARVVG